MAFIPISNHEGKLERMGCATTQTIVKGDGLKDNGSGYLAVAAADDDNAPVYVAMETKTTTANGELVLCLRVDPTIQFIADVESSTTCAQTDVGTWCDLASKSTVDTDSSTDKVFYIAAIDNGSTATKVRGHFAERE